MMTPPVKSTPNSSPRTAREPIETISAIVDSVIAMRRLPMKSKFGTWLKNRIVRSLRPPAR